MISEMEAATKAPPMTAPQDTPDECSSLRVFIGVSKFKTFSIQYLLDTSLNGATSGSDNLLMPKQFRPNGKGYPHKD
jgi:hypothetical protein